MNLFCSPARRPSSALRALALTAAALFASCSAAQVAGTGTIQGTVTDPTGSFIPNATVTLTKPQLLGLLGGAIALDALATEGDLGVVQRLLSYLDPMSGDFPIVTP